MTGTRPYDVEAEEYEPFPEPPRRRTALTAILVGVMVVVLVAGAGAFLWYRSQVDPPGEPGEQLTLTVPRGSSTIAIGEMLEENGVITNATVFRIWLRMNGGGPFQAGEYTFRRNSSFDEAVSVLEDGPNLRFEALTIPEGFTLKQIADRVGRLPGRSADEFLAIANSGDVRSRYQPAEVSSLEGLLLPETYNFEEKDDERAILERMVGAMDATLDEFGYEQAPRRVGVSPYEAVIVASMVEREAKRNEDRAPVAGVIYNRLDRGMLLQIDATLLYARGEHRTRVLNRDKEIDSPYNTYQHKGLTPTPIASPGRAALQAAIDPPDHEFLFYVTINDCTAETVFTRTNAEHERAVARRRAENC